VNQKYKFSNLLKEMDAAGEDMDYEQVINEAVNLENVIFKLKGRQKDVHTLTVKLPEHDYDGLDIVFNKKDFFKWIDHIRDIVRPDEEERREP